MKQAMNARRGLQVLAIALCFACDKPASNVAPPTQAPAPAAKAPPQFVADATCAECHATQAAAWRGSHHDRAMEAAVPDTVLGDFSGADPGFAIVGGKYVVRAQGPDGKPGEFAAPYTFGVAPLQQMLVELPGGRLQGYTTAWDTRKRRWYRLYTEAAVAKDDSLHWTSRYQRWNAQCADCHSTGLRKGYDPATDTYQTRWAEIDVGCQACHGPGSAHVEWARAGAKADASTPYGDGLLVDLKHADAHDQVEACAACHSRRAQIRAELPYGRPLLEAFEPATIEPGLYHPDGQIDGEVYEYGSFLQSKMYAKGVRCSDCHDSHSGKLAAEGNALCVRCHSPQPDERFPTLRAAVYDSPEHHHHKAGSAGASCVGCHMATKNYMVVDPRQDHSIRVPRPDLSVRIGTPNACNGCHADRKPEWAAQTIAKWYGPNRRQEPHFGAVFAAAREMDAAAIPLLTQIALDADAPTIVRATALGLLEPAGPQIVPVLTSAAQDASPWLRSAAAGACDALPADQRLKVAEPLLSDPVLGVRIEAARVLSVLPDEGLSPNVRDRLAAGLREFEAAQRVQADMPGSHLNLAIVYGNRGEDARAEEEYRIALRMDPAFLPASFNLATLLNKIGRNPDAETVLRDAIALTPDQAELHYSLGLLLAESQQYDAAVPELGRAAELMPERGRVRYNYGLALMRAGKHAEAESALRAAHQLDPRDPQAVHALVLFYTESGDWQSALPLARELVALSPHDPRARDLLTRIEAGVRAP
jgi:predicted CXXCH cytochrome family protein